MAVAMASGSFGAVFSPGKNFASPSTASGCFIKGFFGYSARRLYVIRREKLSTVMATFIPQASMATAVEEGNDREMEEIPTPKVVIDQDSDPNATVVEITFGDRLGALLDTMNALKNLGLNVVKANVFLDSSGKHNTFAITNAYTGRKVVDPELLEAIRLTIINNLLQYHPESSAQLAMGATFGVTPPKQQIDVDIATHISIVDDGPDRSLLYVETADRPGLLVDLVKVITDINISVESGEFDTEGLLAKAKFHVSYRGKALIKPLQQVIANSLRYFLRRPTTEEGHCVASKRCCTLSYKPAGISVKAQSNVSCAISMADGQAGDSGKVNLDHIMEKARKYWDKLPQPVRSFPWNQAVENFIQLVFDLTLAVSKYLCIPLLAVSSLSELSYCAHERKLRLVPIPLIIGFTVAGILRETASQLSPHLKDAVIPWHLMAMAFFFLLLKLPGPYYPYWGRIFVPHFANGGLLSTLWFSYLWYRRPQSGVDAATSS